MSVIGVVKRVVIAQKSWPLQLFLAVLFVALAAGSRWLLDRGANGVPFASFLPFVVIAAMIFELRFAVLFVLVSMFVAAGMFLNWGAPNLARAFLLVAYLVTTGLIIALGQVMRQLIIDLDLTSQRYAMFNAELQHRFKNTLQTICAMASGGSKHVDPAQFYRDLTDRVQALNRANQFLGIEDSRPGGLAEAIDVAIQPFHNEAFHRAGPPCEIDGETAMRLMMALHELCTNALKYGALSDPAGTVSITWNARPDGLIDIAWQERGGPPVVQPTRRGLGSRLLVTHGPLRDVRVDYHQGGVSCSITVRQAAAALPHAPHAPMRAGTPARSA